MPTIHISKSAVDDLTPGSKDLFVWDDELRGFGVKVTPKGSKSYVLQYRTGGREAPSRRYTIGRHGSPWTPQLARKEAERLLLSVRQGVDPAQVDLERRRQAVDLAFDAYVERFIDLYLKKRWKQWSLGAGVLRREAVPVLGSKPLPAIRRADLSQIWDRLQDRPSIGRLSYATLRKLFRWAVSRGDIDRSPLEGVEPPPAPAARDRVLDDTELALVWASSDSLGCPFSSIFKILILTGQRREEVAGLLWEELDRKQALWTLSAARSKNSRAHLVPLGETALAVLDNIAAGTEWPRRGLVFSTNGRTPPSGFSKAKRRLDSFLAGGTQAQNSVPWRTHDLRRTVATGLQRLGVRFEVTEAVLNHVSGSKSGIAGVYQRYDWNEEKRAALEAWGTHVCRLRTPA